jgi:hypothetical protein
LPIVVHSSRSGFPGVAHGGYVCGLLAAELGGDSVSVTFLRPVPTDVPLDLEVDRAGARLVRREEPLVRGERAGPIEADLPPPPGFEEAVRASAAYPGHAHHPFATCYCCGPANPTGLHVFPAQVPGRPAGSMAAPWTPEGAAGAPVAPTMMWAALDCPAIWALMFAAPEDSTARVVTGRLHVQRLGTVRAGRRHVVTAWPAGGGGGKQLAMAALHDDAGNLLALMRQTCIEVTGWGVPLSRRAWAPGSLSE